MMATCVGTVAWAWGLNVTRGFNCQAKEERLAPSLAVLVFLPFVPLQADGMGDLIELLAADVLQFLAFGGQLLVDLDRLLGHGFVGFLGAAQQGKIRAGRQALMAVGIQTQAQDDGLPFLFVLFQHNTTYCRTGRLPSGKSSRRDCQLDEGIVLREDDKRSRLP